MKKLLAIVAILALMGCETFPVKKTEIVTVDKPIAFIPPPPIVPTYESQVDKLTDADIKDPGKIAQAYKYDIVALRGLVKIYQGILDQYRASSINFDEINKEIDKLFDTLDAKLAKPAAPVK
jgi:hypothetical protein